MPVEGASNGASGTDVKEESYRNPALEAMDALSDEYGTPMQMKSATDGHETSDETMTSAGEQSLAGDDDEGPVVYSSTRSRRTVRRTSPATLSLLGLAETEDCNSTSCANKEVPRTTNATTSPGKSPGRKGSRGRLAAQRIPISSGSDSSSVQEATDIVEPPGTSAVQQETLVAHAGPASTAGGGGDVSELFSPPIEGEDADPFAKVRDVRLPAEAIPDNLFTLQMLSQSGSDWAAEGPNEADTCDTLSSRSGSDQEGREQIFGCIPSPKVQSESVFDENDVDGDVVEGRDAPQTSSSPPVRAADNLMMSSRTESSPPPINTSDKTLLSSESNEAENALPDDFAGAPPESIISHPNPQYDDVRAQLQYGHEDPSPTEDDEGGQDIRNVPESEENTQDVSLESNDDLDVSGELSIENAEERDWAFAAREDAAFVKAEISSRASFENGPTAELFESNYSAEYPFLGEVARDDSQAGTGSNAMDVELERASLPGFDQERRQCPSTRKENGHMDGDGAESDEEISNAIDENEDASPNTTVYSDDLAGEGTESSLQGTLEDDACTIETHRAGGFEEEHSAEVDDDLDSVRSASTLFKEDKLGDSFGNMADLFGSSPRSPRLDSASDEIEDNDVSRPVNNSDEDFEQPRTSRPKMRPRSASELFGAIGESEPPVQLEGEDSDEGSTEFSEDVNDEPLPASSLFGDSPSSPTKIAAGLFDQPPVAPAAALFSSSAGSSTDDPFARAPPSASTVFGGPSAEATNVFSQWPPASSMVPPLAGSAAMEGAGYQSAASTKGTYSTEADMRFGSPGPHYGRTDSPVPFFSPMQDAHVHSHSHTSGPTTTAAYASPGWTATATSQQMAPSMTASPAMTQQHHPGAVMSPRGSNYSGDFGNQGVGVCGVSHDPASEIVHESPYGRMPNPSPAAAHVSASPSHILTRRLSHHSHSRPSSPRFVAKSSDFMGPDPRKSIATRASNNVRDPSVKPQASIVTFGFGGKVVTMRPKMKIRLNVTGGRSNEGLQDDGSLRKGPIKIYTIKDLIPQDQDVANATSFPGPLLGRSVQRAELDKFIGAAASKAAAGGGSQADDESHLWRLTQLLLTFHGHLSSEKGLADQNSPESAIRSLLRPSGSASVTSQPLRMPSARTETDVRASAHQINECLQAGDREAAVKAAIAADMWPQAMLIASHMTQDWYKNVVAEFVKANYGPGDPLGVMFSVFAGLGGKAVHEPKSWNSLAGTRSKSPILEKWREIICMLIANPTGQSTRQVLQELGDRLWFEHGRVAAAHICYIVASLPLESPGPTSRLVLLGGDHRNSSAIRTFITSTAVQRTEVYEWVQKQNNSQLNLPSFQAYKLLYALRLADMGFLDKSLQYVLSIQEILRVLSGRKGGRDPFVENLSQQVAVAEDRLRQHLGEEAAENVASGGKSFFKKTLGFMDKVFTRVVESGNEDENAQLPNDGGHQPVVTRSEPPVGATSDKVSSTLVVNERSELQITEHFPSQAQAAVPDIPREATPARPPPRPPSDLQSPPKRTASSPALSDPERVVKEVPKRTASPAPARTPSKEEKRKGSSWGLGLSGWLSQKMNPDAKVAKLGDEMEAYYDEKLQRWVFPGEDIQEDAGPPAGPPKDTEIMSSGQGGPATTDTTSNGDVSSDPLAALMAPPQMRVPSTTGSGGVAGLMAPPTRNLYQSTRFAQPGSRKGPRPQYAVFKPPPQQE